MLFSHGSPPRNDKQMPNAFMDVIFLPSHSLALQLDFILHPPLPPPSSLNLTLTFPPPFCFFVFISLPAGVVPDHGSSDHDPVFAAGRLLCLCRSSSRLLCLHHSGGAFRTQGALTRHRHL